VGVFNGAVTSFLRVPSFITTLGMLLTLKGVALLITGGAPRGALPTTSAPSAAPSSRTCRCSAGCPGR
jgi:ribose/xylose/arabinose/galactoside ABC-type transport system permease subunit